MYYPLAETSNALERQLVRMFEHALVSPSGFVMSRHVPELVEALMRAAVLRVREQQSAESEWLGAGPWADVEGDRDV